MTQSRMKNNPTLLIVTTKRITSKFSSGFINSMKKTFTLVVFAHVFKHNKDKTHPAILNKRFQTHMKRLLYLYESPGSQYFRIKTKVLRKGYNSEENIESETNSKI